MPAASYILSFIMRAKDKILEEAAAGRLGFVEAVAELAAASGAVGELKEAKIDHAGRFAAVSPSSFTVPGRVWNSFWRSFRRSMAGPARCW